MTELDRWPELLPSETALSMECELKHYRLQDGAMVESRVINSHNTFVKSADVRQALVAALTRPTPAERPVPIGARLFRESIQNERSMKSAPPSSDDAADSGADAERPVPQVREVEHLLADIIANETYADNDGVAGISAAAEAICEKFEIHPLTSERPSDAAVALPRFVAGRSDNDNPRMSVLIFGEPLTAEHHGEIARRVAVNAIPHEEAVRAQTIEECAVIVESVGYSVMPDQLTEQVGKIIDAIRALQPSKE